MTSRLTRIAIGAVLALVVAAGIVGFEAYRKQAEMAENRWATIGGPFELVDQNGRTVTRDSFAGDYVLMTFGFTHCPDVCPTELSRMATTLDLLGDAAERVQPVFVTVDPERDTVEALGPYVEQFHPDMLGLTGTAEQVAAAAKAFRVYYAKVEQDGGYYTMDHSTFLYLLGPDGQTIDVFPYGTTPDDLAAQISSHVAA